MYIIFAAGSALFAALTSILAKCGIKKTDSNVATALRTIVVLIFAWLMVFVTNSQQGIFSIERKTLVFLVLSGLATGASWLCYFKALSVGDVNKVVPIDKSSTVLTIVLAFIFLRESVSTAKVIGCVLIAVGTLLMIQKKPTSNGGRDDNISSGKKGGTWFIYAALSAVFASLTSILGKIGIEGVDSNLGTAIRTGVVLVMAWVMVAVTGKLSEVKKSDRKELCFIGLSGICTGASWLCYYRALQIGDASVVVPIDKLSILPTVAFAYIFFGEKLSLKSGIGLAVLCAGTLFMTPLLSFLR